MGGPADGNIWAETRSNTKGPNRGSDPRRQYGPNIFAISIQSLTDTSDDDLISAGPEAIQHLLQKFRKLFTTPSELPPSIEIEHHITLKEGSDPINVRPYRYAHFQKEEIERQVQTMLDAGLIRPSSSPFSSPVLLVKKRMGHGVSAPIIAPSMPPR